MNSYLHTLHLYILVLSKYSWRESVFNPEHHCRWSICQSRLVFTHCWFSSAKAFKMNQALLHTICRWAWAESQSRVARHFQQSERTSVEGLVDCQKRTQIDAVRPFPAAVRFSSDWPSSLWIWNWLVWWENAELVQSVGCSGNRRLQCHISEFNSEAWQIDLNHSLPRSFWPDI